MKKCAIGAIVTMVMVLVSAGLVFSEPKNGFSVNAGLASHNMSGKFVAPFTGPDLSYSSSGLSLGIDYQFALAKTFSLNPFLMTSGESGSGDLKSDTSVGHGILGLQLRYWLDDFFLGAHFARYSEVLTNNSASTSATGPGGGLAFGWEKPDGGLYVMAQFDKATVKYEDADVDINGFRLSVGYRWK